MCASDYTCTPEDRQCDRCKQRRPLSDYKRPLGVAHSIVCNHCIDARRQLSLDQAKAYRQKRGKAPKPINDFAQARNAALIQSIKLASRCLFCGEDRPQCLDFHHRDPSTKRYTIAAMRVGRYATPALMAEVAKCVILCANCHRLVHAGLLTLPE